MQLVVVFLPSSKSGTSPMDSMMLWISTDSYNVSLRAVREERTSCSNSVLVTTQTAFIVSVCSTNPLRASAKELPLRSLISCTRLLSRFCGFIKPPRAWPTAESLFLTLSASGRRGEYCTWEGHAAGSGSGSSSMLLTDRESNSRHGGWSREEGAGGFIHSLSSTQDTRCGDCGTGLLIESELTLF